MIFLLHNIYRYINRSKSFEEQNSAKVYLNLLLVDENSEEEILCNKNINDMQDVWIVEVIFAKFGNIGIFKDEFES